MIFATPPQFPFVDGKLAGKRFLPYRTASCDSQEGNGGRYSVFRCGSDNPEIANKFSGVGGALCRMLATGGLCLPWAGYAGFLFPPRKA
jgi:hypothetical protein